MYHQTSHASPTRSQVCSWSFHVSCGVLACWPAYYFQSSLLWVGLHFHGPFNVPSFPLHPTFLSSRTRSPWFFEVPGHNPPGPIQCLKDACSHLLWRRDLGSNLVWFRTKGTELAPPTARPFMFGNTSSSLQARDSRSVCALCSAPLIVYASPRHHHQLLPLTPRHNPLAKLVSTCASTHLPSSPPWRRSS